MMICKRLSALLLAVGAVALLTQPTQAAVPSNSAVGSGDVFSYQAPDGHTYFAVGLRAKDDASVKVSPRDHVVMVDTSASQTGAHRRQALAVVEQFLKSLPKTERVQLFAVDMKAVPLTAGFVSPQGAEIEKGLQSLRLRFPAGATDMEKALDAAMKAFRGDRAKSIVYLGDGMSAANLLQSPQLKDLFTRLAKERVPVHSYAVGPQKDLQVLGMFAQRTGGRVLIDNGDPIKDNPTTVGTVLARAATAAIHYPKTISSSKGLELMPNVALPLRSDRDTIYLARSDDKGTHTVSAKSDNATLATRTVTNAKRTSGHKYLRALWKRAGQTEGLSVSLAGKSLLDAAHDEFTNNVSRLVGMGEKAVAAKRYKDAERIGLAIQEIDPENGQAKALIGAAQKKGKLLALFQQKKPPLPGKKQPKVNPLDKAKKTPGDENGAQKHNQLMEVRTQRLQREVNTAIKLARDAAATNPDGAIGLLKETYDTVKAAEDIHPGPKAEMLRRLETAIQDVNARKEVEQTRRIEALERQAQLEARKRLLERLRQEDEQLETLIDQVRALIDEAWHGNDDSFEEAEEVARKAVDLQPESGVATAALFVSEAGGQLRKIFRLRTLGADRWLETLYQVELSHVPFPDEPPIRWPSAEVWQALTERRKKWASVDLHKSSPAEERIRQELRETTQLNIVDLTLKDTIAQIADLHKITIIIDEQALMDEGIMTDTLVNKQLSGISLRSALNIILEPLALTYVIKDEVMQITTITKAEEILSTRVYPVGDLVMPIRTPLAGGLGQGFGGIGGMGMGGMGGMGQFGMGGAGFGGGMGMGGMGGFGGMGGMGGMFSVPPAKMPKLNQPNQKKNPKPQPVGDPELQKLLDGALSSHADGRFAGQAFAQVKDNPKFQITNETIRNLKKKVTP